ncbi:hypothetical protein E2320_005960, partial [Naja naja]
NEYGNHEIVEYMENGTFEAVLTKSYSLLS